MRLNLGCGEYRAEGWTNVDRRDHDGPRPDIVASILQLPFEDGSAERVYCGHVLEHLDYEQELPTALAEVRRVLADDGELMVVGPDIERARASYPEAIPDIENGAGRWPGDAHLWIPTEATTLDVLTEAGFTAWPQAIEAVPASWPVVSRIGWQFAIEAVK